MFGKGSGNMKILADSSQMKNCDNNTIEHFKVPSAALMERAALAVVWELERRKVNCGRCLVVCGPGNNGGDGLAIARLLHQRGSQVTAALPWEPEKATSETARQLEIVKQYQIPIVSEIPEEEFDVVVDAIFGIGLSREIAGPWRERIGFMNQMGGYKTAVDIPSGVSADSGQVLGCSFQADLTVTFAYAKPGLLMYPGASMAGDVVVKDIGIDRFSWLDQCPTFFCCEDEDLKLLPKREPHSHKGSFGKTLVVAGKHNMAGAAYFSGKASARCGCGLVKIFTEERNRAIIQQLFPEAILATYGEAGDTGRQSSGDVGMQETQEELSANMEWADVIVAGPGLGTGETARQMVRLALLEGTKPMILDADALNILAEHPEWLKQHKSPVIVTPHLGEMTRLTGKPVDEIQKNLLEVAGTFANAYNVICILKDARTVTALPKGQRYINTSGNAGMATAGSGDVLTGILAGLMAQGMEAEEAAPLGVYLHGRAGDAACRRRGSYGTLASDILEGIPEAMGIVG